jgi:hypothetical protein
MRLKEPSAGSNFAEIWHHKFRCNTAKKIFIKAPKEFLNYLSSDSIFAGGVTQDASFSDDEERHRNTNTDIDESIKRDENHEIPEILFPELHEKLLQGIKDLGGYVLPKLGSSTPKDALWITTEHSLRCRSPCEVYQLLKASDRIALEVKKHDQRSSDETKADEDIFLVLSRWLPLDSSMEFRLFVSGTSQIVAICQRDDTVYYPHLISQKPQLFRRIVAFFEDEIVPNSPFPKDEPFVVDIHIAHDMRLNDLVIDFAPWSQEDVSPILFDWQELIGFLHDPEGPYNETSSLDISRFRLIESEQDCRISYIRQNAMPVDWDLLLSTETQRH